MKPGLNDPVLVLNANFEPIHVCNVRRAVNMILQEKAALVLDGRGEIYSVSRAVPCPSIIRLQRMVHRPRPRVKLCSQEIFRRDNYICQYCGQYNPRPTIDHVMPRHMGGGHSWENLVTACPACNLRKGGRTPEQAHMRLLRTPAAPPASAAYIFGKYLNEYGEWLDFIAGW